MKEYPRGIPRIFLSPCPVDTHRERVREKRMVDLTKIIVIFGPDYISLVVQQHS